VEKGHADGERDRQVVRPQQGIWLHPTEQGEDVFVHVTALAGSGMESLQVGQTVQFEVVQGRRGLQAANVRSSEVDPQPQ
jgi:CspA family cold shock protein